MLRNLGVRGKILAVLSVPVFILVLVAGGLTVAAVRNAIDAAQVERLLGLVESARALTESMQAEREAASDYLDTVQVADGRVAQASDDATEALNEIVALAYDEAEAPADRVQAANALLELLGLATEGGGAGETVVVRGGSTDAIEAFITSMIPPLDASGAAPVREWPTEAEVAALAADFGALDSEVADIAEGFRDETAFGDAVRDLSDATGEVLDLSTALATDAPALLPRLETVFASTDTSIAGWEQAIDSIALGTSDPGLADIIDQAQASLVQVEARRPRVLAVDVDSIVSSALYATVIARLNELPGLVASATGDNVLASDLRAYGEVDALVEAVIQERTAAARIVRQEFYRPNDEAAIVRLGVVSDLSLTTAQLAVDNVTADVQLGSFGASLGDDIGGVTSFEVIRQRIQLGNPNILPEIPVDAWDAQVNEELAAIVPVRDELWRAATDRSSSLFTQAVTAAVFTLIAAVVIVLVSLGLALAISRQITGPLLRLSTTAAAVREELPRMVERAAIPGQAVDVADVQIPIETRDEIGDLAEAFNAVNAATLSIAGEQAALRESISEMFVNVARRDQVLLNRQLAAIDEMERHQDDADTLQKLFSLDHLATRMRRNSESLLVLAGIDTGRRMRRPMPLSDVIRTASSEIELYERVQLDLGADPRMLGHSALTAAHLFAELLENATVFSNPGTPVLVRTSTLEGAFLVEVTDQGIGMATKELQDANERIQSTAASEILGAQRLGLFVVGRIARRLGARVDLVSRENEGTTARVMLPFGLFDQEDVPTTSGAAESSTLGGDTPPAATMPGADVASTASAVAVEAPAVTGATPAAPVPVAEASPITGPTPVAPAPASEASPATGATPVAPEAAPTIDATPAAPAEEPAPATGSTPTVDAPIDPTPAPVLGNSPTGSAPAPAPMPSEPVADTDDVKSLIEADAATAPESREVDLEALRAGTTAAGLPTRRRSAETAPEAPAATSSVIGLPPQATTTQMSTLASDASSGFVPAINAADNSAQTPAERASMFRGFHQSRSLEGDGEQRGGAAEPEVPSITGEFLTPRSIPRLEDDGGENR